MQFVQTVWGWILWLIGLAHPQNLRTMVSLGGPPWMGYAVLAAIVFSETGLLVGFFLPGDSMLFAAGVLSSQGVFDIVLLDVVLFAAAVAGDAVNYSAGRRMGEHVFERGRLRLVKHEHLLAARDFYDRHGAIAIVLARFVPIVRTFTPFVAGVARMSYRSFVLYNVVGALGWVLGMTLAGYWLGRIPIVADNFEMVVLGIVLVSVLPVAIGAWRKWRASRSAPAVAAREKTLVG